MSFGVGVSCRILYSIVSYYPSSQRRITVVSDPCFELQKKASSNTFPVETEASSFQSHSELLAEGPRHLNNAEGDWSKV